MAAVEHSLQVLRIDVIDLLQAHSWDAYHPIDKLRIKGLLPEQVAVR